MNLIIWGGYIQVADVSEMVQQQVDALMLSGESAMGRFPVKSLSVLRIVSLRMEEKCRVEKSHELINLQQLAASVPDKISEEICNAAAVIGEQTCLAFNFVHVSCVHLIIEITQEHFRSLDLLFIVKRA
jgi:pyruvate kinase